MCRTVIADDVTFEQDDALGAFRVQIIQRGACEAEIVISQAVMQIAVHRALKAIEARQQRETNVVAFPLPRDHAETA